MNILFLSDYSSLAIDINSDLNKMGFNCHLLCSNIPKGVVHENLTEISHTFSPKLDWLINAARAFFFRYILLNTVSEYSYYQDINENHNYFNINKIKRKIKVKPDLIIILFDYRIITTKTLNVLYNSYSVPIYWLSVDMKPMTGGCSYAMKCINYKLDCKKCPAIGNFFAKSLASSTIRKKVNNLEGIDLNLIVFSSEQYQQAASSKVFKASKIEQFFFPINSDIFKIGDKSDARKKLGLLTDKKIILFGALNPNVPRKGFRYLKEALLMLSKDDVSNALLVVAGNMPIELLHEIPIENVLLGNLNFENLATAYNAADVFICPTIADSGPTMVNQSIMCGTPVVAFEVGVSRDLIINKKTGVLCSKINSYELFLGIKYILDLNEEEYLIMRENCKTMSIKMAQNGLIQHFQKLLV